MTTLTSAQLAVRWQVSPRTVTRMCERGLVPGAFRAGAQWRISVKAIEVHESRGQESAPADAQEQTSTIVTRESLPETTPTYIPVVKGPVPWRTSVIQ